MTLNTIKKYPPSVRNSNLTHLINSEKYFTLSSFYSFFINSLYSSHSLIRFYSSAYCQSCPNLFFLPTSHLISSEREHSLMNFCNCSVYFCLYSSSLLGLVDFKLIDRNFNALSFELKVGYLGLRYPNCANERIMILLRWCYKKAVQSFLLAIFLSSFFFSNSTGSLSGNFTIS